jgi:hypothetical protein
MDPTVTGRCLPSAPGDSRHAWVVFRKDDETYVLNAVAKRFPDMVRRLADVRDQYRPEFGVDRSRRRFTYAGYLLTLLERDLRGPAVPSQTPARGQTMSDRDGTIRAEP